MLYETVPSGLKSSAPAPKTCEDVNEFYPCGAPATHAVHDVFEVFAPRIYTISYLCATHAKDNENAVELGA